MYLYHWFPVSFMTIKLLSSPYRLELILLNLIALPTLVLTFKVQLLQLLLNLTL